MLLNYAEAPAERAREATARTDTPLKSTTPSKVIVLLMVAAIGLFAWRKVTTLPEFGPPSPGPTAAGPSSASTLDHGPFDRLLSRFVRDGNVDYAGLKAESDALDAYLARLAVVDPAAHDRDALLALYINAYNAATLRLILDHYPIASIRDIPEAQRWKDERWTVAGARLSLDALEHDVLRTRFHGPRVHFAIVCASRGCPLLRSEAYVAGRLNDQLDDQMRRAHRDPRYLRWDPQTRTLSLTPLYDWFKADFVPDDGSIVDYVAAYCPPAVADDLRRDPEHVRIGYLDWDWRLNDLPQRPDDP